MSDALATIDRVQNEAQEQLATVQSGDELEQFRIKYLGSNGTVKNLTNLLKEVPKEQKRDVGQRVNAVKDAVTTAFEEKKSQLASGPSEALVEDVTEPGKRPPIGNR